MTSFILYLCFPVALVALSMVIFKMRRSAAAWKESQARQQLELEAIRKSLGVEKNARLEAEKLRILESALLGGLLETVQDHIFFKDRDSKMVRNNPAHLQALGLKNQQAVVGKTDFDFFPKEFASICFEEEQKIMSNGIPMVNKTWEVPGKEGGAKWMSETKAPMRDHDGKVIGLVGISRDITELKLVEDLMRKEHDLLQALLNHMPDHIFFKNRASAIIRTNPAHASSLGFLNAADILGKTDFDFFEKEFAQKAFDEEQEIMRTGKAVLGRIWELPPKDGIVCWISENKVPMRNSTGQVTGLIAVSRDITAQKTIERQFQKAMEVAEDANRSKSVFLANMSHEIRTPMNGVIGMINLLLETDLNAEQQDFAVTVRNSGESLLTIINDILDFSKIEAGKLAIEVIDFDLREVVESTMDLLAEKAQSKGLEMTYLISREVPTMLQGDPGRLRQILLNLLSNAVKFTERGEVVLEVTCLGDGGGLHEIHLAVRDTGIGLSREAVGRLFRAFEQADSSTTRKYGGTGLGLAISRKLVELMQGEIGIESEPGVGSKFWFTIQLPRQANISADVFDPKVLEGVRVLIVDDNMTNRTILHYQVLDWKMRNGGAAGNGPEAMTLLRQAVRAGDSYGIALLDMQMPEMDGVTLARLIKQDPEISGTRLIILTSMCERIKPQELEEAGVDAWLIKPVKQNQLFQALLKVLGGKKVEAGRAPKASSVVAKNDAVPTHKLKILLAEDNIVNQKVAVKQLQRLGFSADVAADGCEVLEAVHRIHYDLILMDCHMPEMDGYQATQKLRQLGHDSNNLYIIAMTANAMQGDREKCLEAGMDDYISKPVKMVELSAALERAGSKLKSLDGVFSVVTKSV